MKNSKLRSVGKAIKIVGASICSLIALAGLGFYFLIVSGVSPTLQSYWVCSAMTTLTHQYLATWFFPQEKIDEIMAASKVHDEDLNSDETKVNTDRFRSDEEKSDLSLSLPFSEALSFMDGKKENYIPEYLSNDSVMYLKLFSDADEQYIRNIQDIENYVPDDKYLSEGYEKLEEGLYHKKISGIGWNGHLMLIENPFRVKLVDTKNQYICGQKVMTMINNVGAVAGINGGGFKDGPNYDSNGGIPAGLLIEDGIIVSPQSAHERANSVYSMIGMNKDGVLVLDHCTANQAIAKGIVSGVTFMPFIIVNGEGTIKNGTGGWGIAPRTAIGQRATGEVIFIVIDGRQTTSIGVDLLPLQETLLAENCVNAAMLDGGSSTVMIYDGEFVNKPCLGFERYINNCWVVMPNSYVKK